MNVDSAWMSCANNEYTHSKASVAEKLTSARCCCPVANDDTLIADGKVYPFVAKVVALGFVLSFVLG